MDYGSSAHGSYASLAPAPTAPPKKSLKDKLLDAKRSVTTSLSTLTAGVPSFSDEPQSLKSKLATASRRFTQVALEKIGRAEASDDSEYETCQTMLLDMQRQYRGLKANLQSFLTAVQALSKSCSGIGEDFRGVLLGADPSLEAMVNGFAQVSAVINDEVQQSMDTALLESVMVPISSRLDELDDLERRCAVRERYKVDYDSYRRSLKAAQEKATPDVAKIARKEAKLLEAQQVLESYSEDLFSAIRGLHDNRAALLLPELKQFQAIQRAFFLAVSRKLADIPDFPDAPKVAIRKPAAAGPSAFSRASSSPSTAAAAASSSMSSSSSTSLPGVVIVRALHNYSPRSSDELALKVGQLIKVTVKEEDGWWHGELEDGTTGMFPSNFVTEVDPASM